MSELRLVPGDDAALIAASNLAAVTLGDFNESHAGEPPQVFYGLQDAVLDELKRRQRSHECVEAGICFKCEKPLGENVYGKQVTWKRGVPYHKECGA